MTACLRRERRTLYHIFLSLLTLQVLVLLFRLHSDYIHLVHLRPDHDPENMASFGPLATPPSSHTPTAATVYGVKRERGNDDDDTGQKPAPRKRVTISRKPCIVCTEDTPKNRFPKLPHKQDDNENTAPMCVSSVLVNISVSKSKLKVTREWPVRNAQSRSKSPTSENSHQVGLIGSMLYLIDHNVQNN